MSHRNEVLSEQIRQVLSNALIYQMRDQNLEGLVFTRVKVSGDLQFADIKFSWPEEEKDVESILKSLDKAGGAFKRIIANSIRLRRIPQLRFHPDTDIAAERRINDILAGLDIPPAEDAEEDEN